MAFLMFFVVKHVADWAFVVIGSVGGLAIFRLDRIVLVKPVHTESEGGQLHALHRDA